MSYEFRKRLRTLHAELIAMNGQFNGFISGDYEVRFLQDDRLTMCVIRNLYKLDERYTGVTVLNPKDKFDAAIGRHKAFKEAIEGWMFVKCKDYILTVQSKFLPVSQLQQDYWKRYGTEEK